MTDNYTHAIFIIEDNDLLLTSLKQQVSTFLKDLPFTVLSFHTVEDALSTKQYPVLVLVDYPLSRHHKSAMNGLEGINVLRQHFPAADFVMITADPKTELFLRSRRFPIYDYLLRDTHTNFRLGLTLDRWVKLHQYRTAEVSPSAQAKMA